jgi:hypothetical protein
VSVTIERCTNDSSALQSNDARTTLQTDHKLNWPEYIQQLTFMYNCTPHSSTGFSPYELFFCRAPYFPIDSILGLQLSSSVISQEEWLTKHRLKMKEMYDRAMSRIRHKAKQRKRRNDVKAGDHSLSPGCKVLLRNRVQGRNKIQDVWNPDVYIVLNKSQG